MAVIQYLDKRGLKTLVNEIKRRTTNVYTIKGGGIYADQAFLDKLEEAKSAVDGDDKDFYDEYKAIDEVGLWQKKEGEWTKISEVKVGWVYNIRNTFETDADFVEGAGHKVEGGTNIVVAKVDEDGNAVKWDLLAMSLNLDAYQTKRLVNVLEIFTKADDGDIITVTEQDTVPDGTTPADPKENDIVLIDGAEDGTDGDVYRYDGKKWVKIGDQVTVEGSLELLGNIAPNTPISDTEIIKAFEESEYAGNVPDKKN